MLRKIVNVVCIYACDPKLDADARYLLLLPSILGYRDSRIG